MGIYLLKKGRVRIGYGWEEGVATRIYYIETLVNDDSSSYGFFNHDCGTSAHINYSSRKASRGIYWQKSWL